MNEPTERLQRLEQALQDQVKSWRLHPVVEALQARCGVQCTVAVTMVAEIGDLTRFDTPRELMTFLGLIPSEYSSGEQRRQGSLTKAGNAHARRALVEGAWAYRDPAKVSRHLQLRRETPPKVIQDISWKAQVRRCKRDRRLVSRGKHPNVVTVAMARELAGCHVGHGQAGAGNPLKPRRLTIQPVIEKVSKVHREEAQPRYGVTLGGVKRLV